MLILVLRSIPLLFLCLFHFIISLLGPPTDIPFLNFIQNLTWTTSTSAKYIVLPPNLAQIFTAKYFKQLGSCDPEVFKQSESARNARETQLQKLKNKTPENLKVPSLETPPTQSKRCAGPSKWWQSGAHCPLPPFGYFAP